MIGNEKKTSFISRRFFCFTAYNRGGLENMQFNGTHGNFVRFIMFL